MSVAGTKAVRVLPDGTRVYKSGHTYKPRNGRAYEQRRPDHPDAVRFHTRWFLPLPVLPEEQRVMPETRPDDQAYEHMFRTVLCRCKVCMRPEAEYHRRRWQRAMGLYVG